MNRRQLVVISERRGYWAAQLRGRLGDRPAVWRETRGTPDLLDAVGGWPCPIVVLDLGTPPESGLHRLAELAARAPSALSLVLDPAGHPGARQAARSLGASWAWSGFAPPTRVAEVIDRWLSLARRRDAQAGRLAWPATEPEADPDDPLALLGP